MAEPILLNNRYRLEQRLGAGGMAMVYRARDLTLERDVAIKVLRENYSNDPGFQEKFRQEARAAANLTHPNIVTVHDFGFDSGRLYIVMEYIPGTDLKTILQRRGRYTIHEAVNLIIQACAGVGYAHRAGLVHCDVKSQNLIITPDKRLKVTDFGIARALATISPEEKSDVVWGSPQYFSPEQASGKPPSPASDVYSLGIVFYEMLTGRLPFIAETAEELARMHRVYPPPPPSRFHPAISPSLEHILLKILSKEPSNRYRTADQLGRVLVTFLKSTTPLPVETTTKEISLESSTRKVPSSAIPNQVRRDRIYKPLTPVHAQSTFTQSDPLNIDWITIFLALTAMIAVGGLVPFWMWVYFLFQ